MTDDDALRRRLFDATPDALWLIDLDGHTLMANQRFADLVGHPLETIASMSGFDVADEQGKSDFAQHLQAMRDGHPGWVNEDVLVVRSDGARIWTLSSSAPVPDADGTGVIGYLHRLTEHNARRRLLDELQDREAQLAHAHRIARLGSWTYDVAADHIEWSPELHEVYGVSLDEFTPTYAGFLERVHPDDRERFRQALFGALNGNDRYVFEGRSITSSGEVRWIRGIGEVERDDDGVAVRLKGTGQDVTERRQALEAATIATRRLLLLQRLAEAANRSTTLADALVRSAQLLEDFSEWAPLCVAIRAERGAPLSVLQLPEPARPDLPAPDLVVAEECWRSREMVLTPLEERPGMLLVSLPVQSGRSMACVVQVVAEIERPDDYTWSLMTQISDQLSSVAERERAAAQLAEARDEAMEASRHKSEFLATMSHEIRTPMNGVIGLTDLLLQTDLDPRQQRLAEGMRGAGLTLLSLINDILDLSKIESGKLELEVIEFDVRAVVEETLMILAGPAQGKGLDLVVNVAPDVPRLVRGDPVRLGQVLTNLGSNAIKFTQSGEVVVSVDLAPLPHDDGDHTRGGGDGVVLQVEVRDTGIGIGDDQVDGLFDAFTQADRSTTRQHGGTGLGLAISRQLVEGMEGEIGVRSAPGAGSVFWFTARFGAVADATGRAHLDRPLRRRRVLVVDGSPVSGSFLVRQLKAWQLRVAQVATAAEAGAALADAGHEGAPYDLVLVDAEADGDGVAVGRRLAATVRVDLVLVAGDGSVAKSDAVAAGFRTTLAKPVHPSALHAALLATDPGRRDDVEAPGHLERLERPERSERAEQPERRERPARPDLGLRVLVVEDNAVNQLVATGLLENLGCSVLAVGNGAEAVDVLVEGHGFDVVLMDCRMPRMDGFDATRAIRAHERDTHVPIIAMTASALPGERERCLEVGMDDFLTKPVDPAQLEAAVVRATTAGPGDEAAATPVPGRTAPTGVLDPERVELLSELVKDGVSFFERTRMSFLSRVDGSLAQISIAVQDGDAERTAADAHQLRGSALNLGLLRVGAAAEAIEELARGGDLTGVDDLLAVLRESIAEGVDALAAVGRSRP